MRRASLNHGAAPAEIVGCPIRGDSAFMARQANHKLDSAADVGGSFAMARLGDDILRGPGRGLRRAVVEPVVRVMLEGRVGVEDACCGRPHVQLPRSMLWTKSPMAL